MKNVALVFAGGTGQRMNTKTRPKQFLELHGKPIIIYTLEQFENNEHIDGIVVACLQDWIPFLEKSIDKFGLKKVVAVVPGGMTGQDSIGLGLQAIAKHFDGDSIVLIHDGVRPLISQETIEDCLAMTAEKGSAITVVPAIETIIKEDDGRIVDVIDRETCKMAKAPQCFILDEILDAHKQAAAEGRNDFIDSASLMRHYGHELYVVEGTMENIKITTPSDFYVFRAYVDLQESSEIFGL